MLSAAPSRSAAIRASVGGCVLKSDISPPPVNGLMMNMCAVAGLASSGTRLRDRVDLAQRVGQPVGLPAICAPPASAANSREREIAIWISIAAIGARIIIASMAIGFEPPSRSSLAAAEHPAYIAIARPS